MASPMATRATDLSYIVNAPNPGSGFAALIARFRSLYQGIENWFSPGEPLPPVHPEPMPRQQQIQPGYNLIYTPRSTETTSFEQLRYFAANYDVARICIQTRKDEVCSFDWDIVAVERGEGHKYQSEIRSVRRFFEKPDRWHDWMQWLSMLIEDRLVIDAATVYKRRTRGGQLYALEIVDGATIKPLVDLRGRRPDPPAPAYYQVLFGTPMSTWDADQLIYKPQNVRSYSPYGMSEIEFVLLVVNMALRKRLKDLAHFTESNIPQSLLGVPDTWTADQIQKFQEMFDEWLAGDLARRSRMIFVPSGGRGSVPVHEFAPFSGDPAFDEWLLKVTCAAMQVQPSEIGFTDDVNRATSEGQENIMYRRGLGPLLRWVKRIIDDVIQEDLLQPCLEFQWQLGEFEDQLRKANINKIYLSAGVIGIDEVREELGKKPFGVPPFLITSQGPTFITDLAKKAKGGDGKSPPGDGGDPYGGNFGANGWTGQSPGMDPSQGGAPGMDQNAPPGGMPPDQGAPMAGPAPDMGQVPAAPMPQPAATSPAASFAPGGENDGWAFPMKSAEGGLLKDGAIEVPWYGGLTDATELSPLRLGDPMPGAVDAIQSLQKAGVPVRFVARVLANTEAREYLVPQMREWLLERGIDPDHQVSFEADS